MRERGAGEQERPPHVDVEHEVVALGREVGDRREVDRRRVVDHHVHPAPALDRGGDERVDLRLVAHVADDRERLAPGFLDRRGGGVDRAGQLRMRLVGLGQQGDARAGAGERDGDREADAAAAAGHHDDTVLERG
jgi:hypothetical protein